MEKPLVEEQLFIDLSQIVLRGEEPHHVLCVGSTYEFQQAEPA